VLREGIGLTVTAVAIIRIGAPSFTEANIDCFRRRSA
jgi:hypothetical protein